MTETNPTFGPDTLPLHPLGIPTLQQIHDELRLLTEEEMDAKPMEAADITYPVRSQQFEEDDCMVVDANDMIIMHMASTSMAELLAAALNKYHQLTVAGIQIADSSPECIVFDRTVLGGGDA